jgi:hypothetical protein
LTHDFLMESAGGEGGSRKRVRTPDQQEEFEASVRVQVQQDRERHRAEAEVGRQRTLVLENDRLVARNKLLELENTIASGKHYEWLIAKDENERLKADLEDTGLKQEVSRLEEALRRAQDELCKARGGLIRCEAHANRLDRALGREMERARNPQGGK